MRWVLALLAASVLVGCSLIKERDPEDPDLIEAAKKPIPPEKAEKIIDSAAGNWFYGEGVGSTAITAGTVVAFPPYLIVVIGNAALSLSGYQPITVSGMLPEKAGKEWANAYDSVASGPGRLTAAVSGKEFRTDEVIKDDMKRLLKENPPEQKSAKEGPDPEHAAPLGPGHKEDRQ